MNIDVKLYSILREKLPPENKGITQLDLPEQATLKDLLARLEIDRRVVISVNDEHEPDLARALKEGDRVSVFRAVSGG